jgi:hypothetical protein
VFLKLADTDSFSFEIKCYEYLINICAMIGGKCCVANSIRKKEFCLLVQNALHSGESKPNYWKKYRLHHQGVKLSQARSRNKEGGLSLDDTAVHS